jgi:hypothetical protein
VDEQALQATILRDLQAAIAEDRARKKYHLRQIRHAGWCYHPLSKAHWLVVGPTKDGQTNNRHARRAAASRARRGL